MRLRAASLLLTLAAGPALAAPPDTTAPARLPPAGGEHPLVQPIPGVLIDTPFAISAFGQDRNGEVYFLDYNGGGVYRLARAAP